MVLAQDVHNTGYKFNPKSTNYKSQIKQMKKYSNLKALRPQPKLVHLPSNKDKNHMETTPVNVVCCKFTSMLFSLLQDNNLNKIENLVVNKKDYFSKFVPTNGRLGEVNSGTWYNNTYETMVKDTSKDFLLPIIFAMDKTTILSTVQRSVYVIMFSTTIFDCKTCNWAHAWRSLGYIPIEKNYHSSAHWSKLEEGLKSYCENMLFETVLQSFKEAQKLGALDDVELTLGNKTKMVNLKVPLAFIIGDIQGGDGICGRSAYYKEDTSCICHMCDITPAAYESKQKDNCILLVMEDISNCI